MTHPKCWCVQQNTESKLKFCSYSINFLLRPIKGKFSLRPFETIENDYDEIPCLNITEGRVHVYLWDPPTLLFSLVAICSHLIFEVSWHLSRRMKSWRSTIVLFMNGIRCLWNLCTSLLQLKSKLFVTNPKITILLPLTSRFWSLFSLDHVRAIILSNGCDL